MKMELKPMDENSVIVKVPTNKADVTREVDVIEEVLRIYGFNKVEIPQQLKTTIQPVDYPTKRDVQNILSDYLSANGFNEIMGISLIESEYYTENESLKEGLVYINNTSNIHLDVMRPDALTSGLRNVVHNINHQQTDLKLFEFGRTYSSEGDEFKEFEFILNLICRMYTDVPIICWEYRSIRFYLQRRWEEEHNYHHHRHPLIKATKQTRLLLLRRHHQL